MTGSLTDRLRRTKFTSTQQKIADYFLNNQERLAGLSSQEAAQEIGVSDASIIRFCRIIGYEGFKDLKAHVFNMLVENSFSGLLLGERMTQSSQKFQQIDPMIQFQSFIYQNMLSAFTSSILHLDIELHAAECVHNRKLPGMYPVHLINYP